jgi:NADP-dependent 3-hydroxy acid dehydrogenase YdfG
VPSIAIVGAGPGMGLAIARTFGSKGFDVALIARNRANLDDLVAQLGADGITAAAFPADVLDRDALTQALNDATARFGGIDVLEYSPVGGLGSQGPVR